MTYNEILKKLMVALKLKNQDIRAIMLLGGYDASKSESSAFMYSKSNKKYRECSSEVLESFLNGLIKYKRGD